VAVQAESFGSGPDLALPGDRRSALGAAHRLLEDLQDRPGEDQLLRCLECWIAAAAEARWAEVHVFLLFSALVHADLTRQDPDRIRALSDELMSTATSYGNEALVALAIAAGPSHLTESGDEDACDDVARCLARVVADLEALVPRDGDPAWMVTPAAYVECAQGYRRHDLWELELEMYDLAEDSLVALFGSTDGVSVEPASRPVLDLNRRVLLFNRIESTVSLVCALVEIGQRDAARELAATCRRLSAQERADLPASWAFEAQAMERLIAVVAGETDDLDDPTAVPSDLYASVADSAWGGYAACLLLAAALANEAAGHLETAAHLGRRAFVMLDSHRPSLRTLAMHLSGLDSAADGTARRYAAHLARLRWESHLQMLDRARSRLSAARDMR